MSTRLSISQVRELLVPAGSTEEDAVTGGTKTSAVEVSGRPIPTMGERIRYLIEHVRRPDGKKYTQQDIAAGSPS